MRVVIQRVKEAEVQVAGETVGRIGPGIVALWGIETGDTWRDAEYCIRKVLNCKLWPEHKISEDNARFTGKRINPSEISGKTWAKSIMDLNYGKRSVKTLRSRIRSSRRFAIHIVW